MNKQYYIGLDVHKETIAIAYTHSRSRSEATFYKTCAGNNPSCERALRKLAKELNLKLQDLKVCYEAGPTGFVLARYLIRLGVDCTYSLWKSVLWYWFKVVIVIKLWLTSTP